MDLIEIWFWGPMQKVARQMCLHMELKLRFIGFLKKNGRGLTLQDIKYRSH